MTDQSEIASTMGRLALDDAEAWHWLRLAAGQGYMEMRMVLGLPGARFPPEDERVDELRELAANDDGEMSTVELPASQAGWLEELENRE